MKQRKGPNNRYIVVVKAMLYCEDNGAKAWDPFVEMIGEYPTVPIWIDFFRCRKLKKYREREMEKEKQQQRLELVRRYLEEHRGKKRNEADNLHEFFNKLSFFDELVNKGLHIDHVQPGRFLCYFKVPSRLVNSGNALHCGAIATLVDDVSSLVIYTHGATTIGVSVEISVSYLDAAYIDEEIEVEAKSLLVGNAVAVINVELRKKKSGKLIAQGRHTKFLPVDTAVNYRPGSSKL